MTMTIERGATQTISTSTYSHPAANTDETHLFAALAEYEYRIGQTLKMLYGEYTYLGDHGKEGVRLAFLPNSGPLDQIRRYLNAGHLRAHLERDVPAQKDREAVIAFFMLSEMDSAQFKEETKRTNALTGPQENAFVRFSNTDDAPAAQPTIAAAAQHNASQRTKYSPKTLLNGRFIRGEKGEYHRLTEARVALVDETDKIRFIDKQIDTFQAATELAHSKGWHAILVTGTEQF